MRIVSQFRFGFAGAPALVIALLAVLSGAPAGGRAADSPAVHTNAFRTVDLAPFASSEGDLRAFAVLPRGLQEFGAIPFLVGPRVAVTGIESARLGDFFPPQVSGIRIGAKARRIHLLHGTMFAEKDGIPLAKIIFRYANGGEESLRIGYGVHVRSWITPRLEKKSDLFDPNSEVAWNDGDDRRGAGARLFRTALENPRPGEAIDSIDVVSLFSSAAPFIAAMTVEMPESNLPSNRPLPGRKPVRDMRELSDSTYRGEISVRVMDGPRGAPATNAVVVLSITDDKETYFFGEARTDSSGACRMVYPPQHAVGIRLWAYAPGRAPSVVGESKTNLVSFSENYTLTLNPGVTGGGLVKDSQGKPVAGAQVIIHRVTRNSPHHYGRVDYDVARTGTDGRWTSHSLPDDLSGLSFQVEHGSHRPALYVTEGFAPPTPYAAAPLPGPSAVTLQRMADGTLVPTRRISATRERAMPLLATNALLAGSAEMVLQPAIAVTGIVLNSEGKPLSDTEVIFQQNVPALGRKYARTDADGRFHIMASAPGSGTVNVIVPGYAPKLSVVNVQPGLAPIELRLSPPRTLMGRVVDRQQRPVPGAKVRVDEWQGTTDLLRFQAVTDDEGRFTWQGAPSDQVTFYVSKSNYYAMRTSVPTAQNEVTLSINRYPGISGKVYDAETRRPIDTFTIVRGRKYSPNDSQIHWERYDTARGYNGEYSIRLDSYYFQPEARIMVEAPGYMPQISPGFTSQDSHTNDFALKKGKGIAGVVQTPDGAPVPSASLVIVEQNESAYMDRPGQFRSTSNGGDLTRSDSSGRFEFSPKLAPERIVAAHEKGFADLASSEVARSGRVVLQPWGRVQGVRRVGDKPEPEEWVRLQNYYDRYSTTGRTSGVSVYLRVEPDAAGNFVFDKVPPGERQIALEYRFKEQMNEIPLTHGFPITIRPGETTNIVLGGTGRKVVGKVNLLGGDHSDIDWKRDVHRLTLVVERGDLRPPDVSKLTPPERQRAMMEFNQRQREFWLTPEGRAAQRAERSYVLLFESNGTFRVENVPPGKYNLVLNVSDPDEEYYNRRTIGSVSKQVTVPDEPGAKVNAPFDIGSIDLKVQSRVRIGKVVPPLELPAQPKAIQLSDFRGKYVLLHFWGRSMGYSTFDLQILRELHTRFGGDGRLVVISCNLDPDTAQARDFAQKNNMPWTQTFLGAWDQTPVPGMFGLSGSTGAVLIDPQGRVASATLRGSAIRNTVMNTVGEDVAEGPR